MDESSQVKNIIWIGSSRADLKAFPAEVKDVMGYALYQAQLGLKHHSAKPLRGFGSAGILEIVEDHYGDTFRAVYTLKLSELIYVLHAFQKKSKRGVATPKTDIDLITRRLRAAEEHYKQRQEARGRHK